MMELKRDTVFKKVRQIFPERDLQEIIACLEAYGTESYEKGKYRVYLAILKPCDEENLSGPTYYVKAAKQDFRDILAWAEYPNQMKLGPTNNPEKSAQLAKMDKEQYHAWSSKT